MADGAPARSPADPDTLVVPLKHLPRGLVPRLLAGDLGRRPSGARRLHVRGRARTPARRRSSRCRRSPRRRRRRRLVAARWVVFLAVMAAIGLFVLRHRDRAAARAARRRARACARSTSRSASPRASALVAIPVYLLLATAVVRAAARAFDDRRARAADARRPRSAAASSTSSSASRCSSLAAGVALWVDRPEREQRSIAELLATGGALAAAAAVLVVPGAAGHAAQTLAARRSRSRSTGSTSPPARSGSAGWSACSCSGSRCRPGCRRAGLAVVVPRFSNVAFVSVLLLLGSGHLGRGDAPADARRALGDALRARPCSSRPASLDRRDRARPR